MIMNYEYVIFKKQKVVFSFRVLLWNSLGEAEETHDKSQ